MASSGDLVWKQKVLVVPFGMCWSLDVSASLVVVMGTESYDGREHKYVDYPVTDLLHMTGLASRYCTPMALTAREITITTKTKQYQ